MAADVELQKGTPAQAASARVLVGLAAAAEARAAETLVEPHTRALHQLRISIRRARSVLRELKQLHEPEARARLQAELKWAQALTGPVRDLDVQLMQWEPLVARLDREPADALEPLRAALELERDAELAQLRRDLQSMRFAALLGGWRDVAVAAPPPRVCAFADLPIELVAGARVSAVYRRMARDGSRIDDGSPPEALHDLRKRGKELRYLLELFGSVFPKRVVKPLVATLKDLQDVLGRFQDSAVQAERLRSRDAPPGASAAVVAIEELLVADQHDARERFAKAFSAFTAGEQRRRVRDTFAKRAAS